MKNIITHLSAKMVFTFIMCCTITNISAQIKKVFEPRFSETVNGNMTMIANNVLSRHATNNYNGSEGNHNFDDNVFVDIDTDNSTFNSSNATFLNPLPAANCLVIKKAYLYWAAADLEEDNPNDEPNWNYNQVKLMLPGENTYTTIAADDVIYRGRDEHFVNDPYICFKDITTQVGSLNNPFDKYQIANVRAKEGELTGHGGGNVGTSGGWEIVFIYENPTLPKKNITIFDGYAHVTDDNNNFNILFDGFLTVPTGDVNTSVVIGGLEGDRDLENDRLQIRNVANNWVDISTTERSSDNFFNSKITKDGADFTDRVPESTNTLGFDAAVFNLNNSNNTIIDNNQTSATMRLTSDQETYGLFLLGLAVDVWEPNMSPIVLQTDLGATTTVNNDDTITFSFDVQNTGNDDAVNLVVQTTLPEEADFIGVNNLPNGVSYNYNPVTRLLTFTVNDDSLTEVNAALFNIEFEIKIKDNCYFLETKCSNSFQIQLQATYNGVMNPKEETISSSSGTDNCGIGDNLPNTFDINQPAIADWITVANDLDRTLDCSDTQGLIDAQNLTPQLDTCNLTPIKTSGQFVQSNTCPSNGTYTNTWVYTDVCGRTTSVFTQTITIQDNTAPIIANAPADITVECIDDIPVMIDLAYTDNCDTNGTVTGVDSALTGDACGGTITRTWNIADACGNSAVEMSQIITINDTIAPVLAAAPADVTVECIGDVPAMVDLGYTDNCDPAGSVAGSDGALVGGSCGGTITRTWNIMDACGNSAIEVIQTITVDDNTAPVFDASSLPQSVTLECSDNIPALEDANVTATDNCSDVSDIVITPSEVITNQDDECSNNYTITRTWIANDCAGNSIQHVQVITVEDNTAPVFDASSLPQNVTLECSDNIPALEDVVLTATDNCSDVSDIIITPSEVITNQDDECSNNYTITRTWIANDCAGNSIQHVQVITVEDNTAPVFDASSLPQNVTLECSDNIPALEDVVLTVTDNCSDVSDIVITPSEVITNQDDECSNNYTITRTWIANDCAGNSIQHVQVITVEDNTAPVFDASSLPQNVTLECSDNIPALEDVVLTATDNCSDVSDIVITPSEVITNQDDECSNNYTITRTWIANDCAGNSIQHVQVITVEDNTAPVFDASSLPQNVTLECSDNIPALEDVVLTATDNCSDVSDIIITPSEVITNQDDDCSNNYTITRTWVANDCAGNSIQHVQVITVEDNTAPVFDASSLPQNVTLECSDNIPALEDVVLTATDNCSDVSDIIITPSEVITNQDDECSNNYTITRTWIANDCAGNSIQHVQVITVEDNTAPVFDASSLPQNVTLECSDNIPALEDVVLTATDNCSDVSDIVITPSEVITNQDDECSNNYTITRTWIANDCAGNSIQHVQVITVEDNTAPVFDASSLPQNVTLECSDNIPALEDVVLTATDNCSDVSDIVITPSEVITNQDDECSNNYTITRTWIANDCAGNSIQHVQVITVEDNTAPVFDASSLPQNVTLECSDNIPALEDVVLTATDNCSDVSDIIITPSEVITNQDDDCSNNYTITRTWIANDCAGNSIQHVQVITVEDNTAPVLSSLPANTNAECDSIPDAEILTATDNCDTNLDVDFNEQIVADPNGCATNYTINRTWTVTDCAGNTTEHTQVITVEDNSVPVLSGDIPADTTVECDNIPDAAVLTVEDNCGNNIPIAFTEVLSENDDECANNYIITRTWTVTDCAGNSTQHVQVITVEDNTAPVFDASSLPQNVTLECSDNIPALEDVVLTATDNCSDVSDIIITPSEVITNQDDECSNNYTITRTWIANDCAGNSIQHVQVITVEDNTAPVFDASSLPQNVTLECSDNIPALEDVVLTATDNCSDVSDIIITPSEVITNQDDECSNNYTITRTWIADDCAGNSIQHVQVITVEDNTAPVFDASSLPQNVTLECSDNIPALEDVVLTATDNCSDVSDIIITPSEVITNQDDECSNNYTITRTWIANDCAGNSIQHVQVITVEDNTAPVLSSLPANTNAECDSIPDAEILTATDNCDTNLDVDFNEQIVADPNGCATNYTINRTWTVTDCAGNTTEHTQVITVEDNSVPVLSGDIPADTTVECDNIPDAAVLTVEDNCGNNIPIAFTEVLSENDDECANNYIITRTWTVTDCAGNSTQHVQVITVEDNTAPVFDASSLPQNVTLECSDNIPALEDVVLTATDNCSDVSDIIITPSEVITNQDDDCSNNYTITRTWIANDCAGNSIQHVQVITVEDNTAPVFDASSLPQNVTLECSDNIPALEDVVLTATDNCSDVSDIIITPSEVITNQDDDCSNNYTITRTWIANDCAGNSIQHVQVITVEDNTAPVFDASSLPQNVTLECSDPIPTLEDVVLTATDNCSDVSDIIITPSEVITNQDDDCSNNYTITRTWIANDCAGNSIQHIQVITIVDTTLPLLSEGSDGSAECTGTDPSLNEEYIIWRDDFASITASDDCGEATLSVTEGQWIQEGCSYTMIINIIATDKCGLVSEVQERTFTISDTTAPEILTYLDDILFYCNEVPPVPEIDVEENCSEATIVFTETTIGTEGSEDYQIIRTWTISDDCGNETIKEQVLLVEPSCDCLEDKFITKAITPNGDIYNDYFKVEGIDDCGIPSLKIFNRWGALVYQSDNYDSKKGRWRGTSHGGVTIGGNNELPTGTYYYIIEIRNSDIKPITGHVYLSTK